MDETVVISGGTRGLGRALSLAFGRAGYAIRALYRSNDLAAAELAREFEAHGIRGECLRCDIGQAVLDADLLAGEATKLIVVNNAWPLFEPRPLHLSSWEQYDEGFSSGVKGAVALTRVLLPRMLAAKSGTVVNVLTAGLLSPTPKGFGPYLTAKQALVGFGCALAAEYGALGVRVLGVCPPFMDTPRTRAWNDRVRQAIGAASGGAAEPAHVAAAVLALVQDASLPAKGELHAVGVAPKRGEV